MKNGHLLLSEKQKNYIKNEINDEINKKEKNTLNY